MLTSSNQYLRPDYLSPLPTTLDAKKSPLALLAQTCSAIGADTPNPKLISAAEKASVKSGHKYVEAQRERSPPVPPPAHDNKPSFKPYESCLTAREKTRTPEERTPSTPHPRTPLSGKNSSAGTPAPTQQRCASNQSCSSRTSPATHRKTPSEKSDGRASPPRDSPAPPKGADMGKSAFANGAPTSSSESKDLTTSFKQTTPVTSSAFLSALPHGGFPLPVDLMTSSLMAAQHHALKSGLNPYLAYARMKAPGGAEMSACRDPYCTGCSLSSHLLKAVCPAGCAHCEHAKPPFPLAGHPAAAAYAHAQLAALAAASQLPFVCSWMGGETAYCGKRFSSSEELLQHLRSHTANGESSAGGGLALLGATHPLLQRSYPTPPLSPLTPRFHPYSKPAASQLVSPQLPFPFPQHPSLAAYFPSYPLFGPRPLHP